MKLQLVPARQGVTWVRLGIRTFFSQPLALSGLFFMYAAVMEVAKDIPVVGLSLMLALMPGCSLGLMAASREASTGKFPMPTVFLSAFRAGRQELVAMAQLGVLFVCGFWIILGITTLLDGGGFASGYLSGKMLPADMARDPAMQTAGLAFLLLLCLLSLMFWLAGSTWFCFAFFFFCFSLFFFQLEIVSMILNVMLHTNTMSTFTIMLNPIM